VSFSAYLSIKNIGSSITCSGIAASFKSLDADVLAINKKTHKKSMVTMAISLIFFFKYKWRILIASYQSFLYCQNTCPKLFFKDVQIGIVNLKIILYLDLMLCISVR
jgi:hypothetical protein